MPQGRCHPLICSLIRWLPAAALLLAACGESAPLPIPTQLAPTTPTAGVSPDARAVAPDTLLPQGSLVEQVLYGRVLPGPGEQIVVHSSRDIGCPDRQDHLHVFAYDGGLGSWDAVFDGDLWPSASGPLIPDREDVSDGCRGGEEFRALALTDLDQDGLDDLVLGMDTSKDGKDGPLLLEVLSFAPGVAEPLYEEATQRGGAVRVEGRRVILEQPTFPDESGPLWRGDEQPNGLLTQVIAFDEELGQLLVVERSNSVYCASGVVERASREAIFVACAPVTADGPGRRVTGYRVTGETRVLPAGAGAIDELQAGREVSVRSMGSELDSDDDVNPVAVEVLVLNERHARR